MACVCRNVVDRFLVVQCKCKLCLLLPAVCVWFDISDLTIVHSIFSKLSCQSYIS